MIQKIAHATNIAPISSFQGESAVRELQWKISNSLQTTLDVDQLIELFNQSIREIVDHNGFSYTHDRENLRISGGVRAHHSCSYRLIVEEEDLGELQLQRRRRFSEQEISKLESLLSCLVYPLRNALLYREALRSAHTDALTEVNNRVAMEDCIKREWELAQRQKTPLSLMLIDIDHFKSVNDRHGHLCGDKVLKSVARTIRQTVRACDMIYRYGGEEFVVVLSNTEIDGAMLLAERIRQAIENLHVTIEARTIQVTVSLGVTSLAAGNKSQDLVLNADMAMYEAKQNGRNQVRKKF